MAETVVMTLTEFLLARIAEDEAVARDAYYEGQRWVSEEESVVAADRELDPLLYLDRKRDAFHAAQWAPARVLAECDAKRRIVEWCGGAAQWLLDPDRSEYDEAPIDYSGEVHMAAAVLRALALPYADHPDYDEAWRP